MEPKSKAKQLKRNLVSPIGCYCISTVTNQSATIGDNLVGMGYKKKQKVLCNVMHRG